MYYRAVALICLLLAALPALAAERKFDPEARSRDIAPFVDAQTIAIVHFDVSRADADALLQRGAEIGKKDLKDLAPVRPLLQSLLGGLNKAGGKDLYVLFSLTDLLEAPIFIVPLEAGADTKALESLVNQAVGLLTPLNAEKIGDALVVGTKTSRERLRKFKPQPRPEVAKAFDAAGDTLAQALLLPTADTRRVFEEVMPTLPAEVGGGSMKTLTQGVQWLAVGVDLMPMMSLRAVIQSKDAAAAQALHDWLDKALKKLGQNKQARAVLPNFDKLAALLAFQLSADRLTRSLDEAALHEQVQPFVRRLLDQFERTEASNKLRQIGAALHDFNDKKGRFPAAATYSADKKPLLSWRVQLLPFLGEEKLYQEFHLQEPWDSEHNRKLIARIPAVYRGIRSQLKEEGKTTFLVPTGENTMFPGMEGLRISDITDGLSNTIMALDADDDRAVIWTKPDDLKMDPKDLQAGLGKRYSTGFLALFADGTVHFLCNTISPVTLGGAFTPNGGEVLGPDLECPTFQP